MLQDNKPLTLSNKALATMQDISDYATVSAHGISSNPERPRDMVTDATGAFDCWVSPPLQKYKYDGISSSTVRRTSSLVYGTARARARIRVSCMAVAPTIAYNH